MHRITKPNVVAVGTIVWLSSELMFFAALFAGSLPEQYLRHVRVTAAGQYAGRHAQPRQHPIGIGTTGPQRVERQTHQRHIVGEITHR